MTVQILVLTIVGSDVDYSGTVLLTVVSSGVDYSQHQEMSV